MPDSTMPRGHDAAKAGDPFTESDLLVASGGLGTTPASATGEASTPPQAATGHYGPGYADPTQHYGNTQPGQAGTGVGAETMSAEGTPSGAAAGAAVPPTSASPPAAVTSSAQAGTTGSAVVTSAATEDDAAPLHTEDVHFRPPDHLPTGETPESENAALIFERS